MPVEFERVPPEELAVHQGAHVRARDGRVGRVDEWLVNVPDGHITRLVAPTAGEDIAHLADVKSPR